MFLLGILDDHRKVQSEVGYEWKGMGNVYGKRCQDRNHGFAEIPLHLRRLLFVQILVIQHRYPGLGQGRQQVIMHEPRNKAALLMQLNSAGPQFLFQTQPAAGGFLFFHPALEPAHAFHGKFIVKHPHDACKLDTLKQGQVRILNLRENAPGETEPA